MKSGTENSHKFECSLCDYVTSKKTDWNRHLLTSKHINRTILEQNSAKSDSKINYTCYNCNKTYNARNSLWYHKKQCKEEPQNVIISHESPVVDASNNLIMELIKQNLEFKELIIELVGKVGNTNSHNTTNTTNSNNQHFNLQFFLNETCKDALNIDEFVNQIKLQLSDLDMIGQVGYVEGMSKIFLRSLKDIEVCKRPIHCSDLKRETLYVKDKDVWEKGNGENDKIKKAIKGVECKNVRQIPQWMNENPTHEDTDTRKHMEYHHILVESMGGLPLDDDNKKHEKIIRNIAKEVVIDKNPSL